MRLALAVLPLALLGALPASASAAADLATTATVSPNPGRTGQDVTITITTTNTGPDTTVYPVFQRFEASGAQGFGTSNVTCGSGTQTQPGGGECRLDGALAAGASATMTVTGFSPNAGSTPYSAAGFTYDDPNRANDTKQGQIVIEGPVDDGSGAPRGGTGTSLPAFALTRPSLRARVLSGRRVTVRTSVDRIADLAVVLERQGRGGKFRRVRGTVRRRCRPSTPCVLRFARLNGKLLAPGIYRLMLVGTDQRGERAQSPKKRFRVTPSA